MEKDTEKSVLKKVEKKAPEQKSILKNTHGRAMTYAELLRYHKVWEEMEVLFNDDKADKTKVLRKAPGRTDRKIESVLSEKQRNGKAKVKRTLRKE